MGHKKATENLFLRVLLGTLFFLVGVAPPVALAGPLFPEQEFQVGDSPTSVAVGDLNGDGRADLAVANEGSSDVSILLGNGEGTFRTEARFAAGASPAAIALADFDGDSFPDLAVADFGFNAVCVLSGNGDGTFGNEKFFGTGEGPRSLIVADFNRDNYLDLAVANSYSNDVSILLGNGDGTFGDATSFATGNSPRSVALADFNRDGEADLVVADFASSDVSVLLGNGDGTFGATVSFAAGNFPISVAAGDFNEDGRPDVAVANIQSHVVSVLLGNGDGTFGAPAPFAAGMFPSFVTAADFNADGRPDLAVGSNQFVSVLLGKGNGTFDLPMPFLANLYSTSVGVGDFNGDNRPDLAVTKYFSQHLWYDVCALLGNGDGTFKVPELFAAGTSPSSVAVADFNGDGRPDLVTANGNSNDVSLLLGNGDGTFGEQARFGTEGGPYFVTVGDFNEDGHIDLVVGYSYSNDGSVLLGNGDGTFGAALSLAAGMNPFSIAVADFNGDRRPDLAVATAGSYGVTVLLGNGDGTFGAPRIFAAGTNPDSVAVADFNRDGRLDLAVANQVSHDVSVLLGQGDGTFGAQARLAVGYEPATVVIGDFNEDGRPDLAVAGFGSNGVSVVLGKGDGTFGSPVRFIAGVGPYGSGLLSLAVGDFDGDGHPDLAAVNFFTHDVSVLLGIGDGTFNPQVRFVAGYYPNSVAVGDFNADGRQDLAVANIGLNAVSVLLNQKRLPNRPPVAVAKADPRPECTSHSGAEVTLDGSASSDPDSSPGTYNDIKQFRWFERFGTPSEILLGDAQRLSVTLGLGQHVLTLQVTDSSGASSTAEATVTVVDTTPPVVICPEVGPVECSASGGSPVNLLAAATDACSPTVTVTNSRTAGGADASSFYPLGMTSVTFTAADATGSMASCATHVTVEDTTPPQLALALNPRVLWPPNHRMVPVQAALYVSEACDPVASATLVSTTSSEPDDAAGNGDGSTTGDIQGAAIGTPDPSVLLRAERSGDGPGRIYTLTYAARDASGNTGSALAIVTIPHDEGSGPEPVMIRLEDDGRPGMAHLYWNAVSGAEMYDVIQGDLSQVSIANGEIRLGPVHVLASGQNGASYSEGPSGAIPAVGSAYFYLVQYREGQSASGWGTESSPWPAEPSSCDIGCPGEPVASSVASMILKRK